MIFDGGCHWECCLRTMCACCIVVTWLDASSFACRTSRYHHRRLHQVSATSIVWNWSVDEILLKMKCRQLVMSSMNGMNHSTWHRYRCRFHRQRILNDHQNYCYLIQQQCFQSAGRKMTCSLFRNVNHRRRSHCCKHCLVAGGKYLRMMIHDAFG